MKKGKGNTEHIKLRFEKIVETIRKNPEMQDELFHYENTFGKVTGSFKNQYWFLKWTINANTDVKFFLPTKMSSDEKQLFLLSFLLNPLTTLEIDLSQNNEKFHVNINDSEAKVTYCLEDIPVSKLASVVAENIYEIMRFCNVYHSENPETQAQFDKSIQEAIQAWNTHPEIIRQKYYKLSRDKTMPDMAALGDLSERSIIAALDDYENQRTNRIVINFFLLQDYINSEPVENPYYNGRVLELLRKIMNGLESGFDDREEFFKQLTNIVISIEMKCVFKKN